jgi:hypothetical protein
MEVTSEVLEKLLEQFFQIRIIGELKDITEGFPKVCFENKKRFFQRVKPDIY